MQNNKMFSRVRAASISGLLATVSTVVPLTGRAADTGADETALQEVVVTGSRLGSSGFSAPTPVTVVGFETIEQRAPANIADVINEQPAFKASSSDTTRGGTQPGSGQQVLNLRALGAVRTLVLLNGRRVAPTLWDGTVDTAIIPTGLVERTEVVTGGASAAYGSDAVAGVVNIILRDSMHGVRASVQGGYTEYGAGKQYTATLAGGTSFFDNRLNILGGVDFNDSKTVKGPYDKSWGRQEIGNLVASPAQRTANPSLPQTIIGTNVEPGSAAPGGLLQVTNTNQTTLAPGVAYTFDANGNPVLFNQGVLYGNPTNANLLMTGSTANYGYSGNNINALRAPTRRTDVYVRTSYAITDHVKAYLEGNKSLDVVDPFLSALYISQGGANGATTGMPQLTIGRTNPFVTPATLALIGNAATFTLGRIDTEFGLGSPFGIPGVAYKSTTNVGRVLGGVQGDFGKDWKWDAYFQRGTTELTTYRQEYSPTALQFAVDNCTGNVGLNAAQLTALNTYNQLTGKTCIPFNPFGVGRNSIAAQNYFMQMIWTKQELAQNVFAASINGSLLDLPAGPLAVATGAEYRRDQARGTVDNVTAVGNLLSNNFQPLARDNNSTVRNIVKEAFVELGAPLLKDKPFARSLDLNAAVRRTDYSQSGMVSTWKAGFTWEPIEDLRVRFARSRDIRAPNLNEIYFQGGLGVFGNLVNHIPRGVVGANGTVNLNAAGLANNTSLTVTQNGPSGGGPLLKPEIADTTTFGVVWRQGGFDASLDYYQITVNGVISGPQGGLNAQQVVDGCAAGDSRLCQMITFDSSSANLAVNGGLALVAPTALNLLTQTLLGYDFEMGYRLPMLGGNFSVRGLVNYQPRNRSFNPIFNVTTDAANVLGNQPLVGYNLSLGFQKGKWNTDVQIRGFTGRRGNAVVYNPDGSVATSATISNTSLYTVLGPEDQGYVAGNAGTVSKNRFAGQYLVNPTVNYKITDKLSAFVAIDNLFNVDPAALTTNSAYDLIGRRYRAGVRAEF